MVPEILTILYTPCSCSNTLPECQPLLLHLLLIHHPWPTRCQFTYHFLCTTGLPATKCEIFAYSSASWRLGPRFARSRLRKNLIICSTSWAKRAMPPWTDGYQQMKHTRMTPVKFLDYIESMLDDEISP